MNLVDCPYTECQYEEVNGTFLDVCPVCKQRLKRCKRCNTSNRAFSNFCRYCGETIGESMEAWSGSKGGVQRQGLNRHLLHHAPPDIKLDELKSIKLSNRCRSFLASEEYLFAISEMGLIKAIRLDRFDEEPFSINTNNKIFAEPAIHRGTLYVGCVQDEEQDKGEIQAYTLGGLSLNPPEMKLRWKVHIKGMPVQALLPFEDRLYLNVGYPDGEREIHVIDNIRGNNPAGSQCVFLGGHSSMLVADSSMKKVFFLSQIEKKLFLNSFDHTISSYPNMISNDIPDSPSDFLDHMPIAVMGSQLFAVFGDSKDLCRFDTHLIRFDQRIVSKVRLFAVAGMGRYITVNATGVHSTIGNTQEDLLQGESIMSGPIVFRDKMFVVGLSDGRIRFYNLNNPSIQSDFHVFSSNERVQSMAVFKNIVIVGNQNGEIKILQIG